MWRQPLAPSPSPEVFSQEQKLSTSLSTPLAAPSQNFVQNFVLKTPGHRTCTTTTTLSAVAPSDHRPVAISLQNTCTPRVVSEIAVTPLPAAPRTAALAFSPLPSTPAAANASSWDVTSALTAAETSASASELAFAFASVLASPGALLLSGSDMELEVEAVGDNGGASEVTGGTGQEGTMSSVGVGLALSSVGVGLALSSVGGGLAISSVGVGLAISSVGVSGGTERAAPALSASEEAYYFFNNVSSPLPTVASASAPTAFTNEDLTSLRSSCIRSQQAPPPSSSKKRASPRSFLAATLLGTATASPKFNGIVSGTRTRTCNGTSGHNKKNVSGVGGVIYITSSPAVSADDVIASNDDVDESLPCMARLDFTAPTASGDVVGDVTSGTPPPSMTPTMPTPMPNPPLSVLLFGGSLSPSKSPAAALTPAPVDSTFVAGPGDLSNFGTREGYPLGILGAGDMTGVGDATFGGGGDGFARGGGGGDMTGVGAMGVSFFERGEMGAGRAALAKRRARQEAERAAKNSAVVEPSAESVSKANVNAITNATHKNPGRTVNRFDPTSFEELRSGLESESTIRSAPVEVVGYQGGTTQAAVSLPAQLLAPHSPSLANVSTAIVCSSRLLNSTVSAPAQTRKPLVTGSSGGSTLAVSRVITAPPPPPAFSSRNASTSSSTTAPAHVRHTQFSKPSATAAAAATNTLVHHRAAPAVAAAVTTAPAASMRDSTSNSAPVPGAPTTNTTTTTVTRGPTLRAHAPPPPLPPPTAAAAPPSRPPREGGIFAPTAASLLRQNAKQAQLPPPPLPATAAATCTAATTAARTARAAEAAASVALATAAAAAVTMRCGAAPSTNGFTTTTTTTTTTRIPVAAHVRRAAPISLDSTLLLAPAPVIRKQTSGVGAPVWSTSSSTTVKAFSFATDARVRSATTAVASAARGNEGL